MKLKSTLAGLSLLGLTAMAGATTSWNLGSYTVSYDETTAGFGYLAGAFTSGGGLVGFNWAFSPAVQVTSLAGVAASATFALPDFTISVNPGYSASGPVKASMGNLVYFELLGGSTSITGAGTVQIDADPAYTLPAAPLAKLETGATAVSSLGYFADSASTAVGGFSSFSVSASSITLNATGTGASSFASIGAQPQNQYKIEFYVAEVPEPQSYALLLGGLGVLGWVARRRQR